MVDLAVVEQRVACCQRVSDKANAARSSLGDLAAAQRHSTVVVVDKNPVPTHLVQKAIFHCAILSSFEEHRTTAINGPVGAQQWFLGVHDRSRRVPQRQTSERHPAHRGGFVATKLHQAAQASGFHSRVGRVQPPRWIEIKAVRCRIQEPFSGRVELFENILHVSDPLVHGSTTIVLPAALHRDSAVRVLASNPPGEVAPESWVHRMEVASGRIGPPAHPVR